MADELADQEQSELEKFVRSYIQRTPSVTAKERIQEMFGKNWNSASKSQKIGSVLSGLGGLLTGRSQYDLEREKALEEYKTVAPTLQRESAVIAAEQKAAQATRVAEERNDIARLTAQSVRYKNEAHAQYEAARIALESGNLKLAQDKFAEAKRINDEAGPKLTSLAQSSAYYQRLKAKDPDAAQAWLEGFADLNVIQGAARGMGQGQGGTTTTTSERFLPPVQDQQGRWQFFSAPATSRSQRTPGANQDDAMKRIQDVLQRSRGASGAALPQLSPDVAPAATQPAAPLPAAPVPAPQAALQNMIRPQTPGPASGGANQPALPPGVRNIMTLPEEFSRTTPEMQAKRLTADREARISGLARAMPEWWASGNLDDVIGTPEGWIEGARRKLGTSNEQIQTIDWVLRKGLPSEVNESSGLQFSTKELEIAEANWPKITDHPRSIMQRMNMINMTVQGSRYMRELGLTQRQRDLLAGYWFKEMADRSAKIVQTTEDAKGRKDWRNRLPSNVDMDPRVPVALAIRKARAANPKDFPLPRSL